MIDISHFLKIYHLLINNFLLIYVRIFLFYRDIYLSIKL